MFNNNADFYPTPKDLQRKMLNKIDWRKVQSCLEPSAGKGDLVEGIIKQFEYTKNYHRTNKYDVDAVEKDENLIHILKSKGHRVVADDFLSFYTYKSYDSLVANFPFSEGDKHALHAIELIENQMKSCQMVFLVNAETLKNPYSNTRKVLIQKLEKHNAEVEYIDNAFISAERSTGVTIAMVYLVIEKEAHNSVILNELKQEEVHQTQNNHNTNNLIDSDFIKGIVQQYNYEVKAGLKLIEEYNSLKPFMLRSFKDDDRPVLKLELEYEDKDGSNLENAYIKQIRSKYWKALFNNDQFMGLFTNNLKQKYMQHVEELKDYDFSFYNIYSLRIELSKEMVQGVEDTILNLFEEFSYKHYYDESSKNIHMYNGWKTNKAYKINKKVIIPLNGFNSWWNNRYEPTNYQVKDKLKDIEKVFNYLDDGQTEDIDLEETLKFAEHYGETKKIDTKYFLITFYKKGTCHIEFKNMDLLKKFNLFAAKSKMWLPPSYGEAKYNDMTAEEKAVINDFEGEKSYNDVMKNKSYFIMKTEELLKLTS
jgi:phospholipid N-methyltransferase